MESGEAAPVPPRLDSREVPRRSIRWFRWDAWRSCCGCCNKVTNMG